MLPINDFLDPIEIAVKKFQLHPNIFRIKERNPSCNKFELGPFLFNIYLNDSFIIWEETKIWNYTDDTTIYVCGPEIKTVFKRLERDALKIADWFSNDFMKRNEDKCHLMIFGVKRDTEIAIRIGEACIKESKEQSLLGITLDQTFSFKTLVRPL